MKPTKIRNLQLYRAPRNILSKQLGSNLSKDLRQKYGKRSIRVTVGDTVKIVRGEYKGIDGKVKEVDTLKNAVTIEGIKKEKLKGGQFDVYIHSTNLLVTELNTNDKWRIQKLEGTKISKQKETKPKDQEEVKQKEVKGEEKQKESKETELTPKQELKTKQTTKKPKEPKAKPAPKKAKKESKEKKDEK